MRRSAVRPLSPGFHKKIPRTERVGTLSRRDGKADTRRTTASVDGAHITRRTVRVRHASRDAGADFIHSADPVAVGIGVAGAAVLAVVAGLRVVGAACAADAAGDGRGDGGSHRRSRDGGGHRRDAPAAAG